MRNRFRPVPVRTGIFLSAYRIVRIASNALPSKDGGAGEERGKLKTEGWAGDQLPLPVFYSRFTHKIYMSLASEQLLFQPVVLLSKFEIPSH